MLKKNKLVELYTIVDKDDNEVDFCSCKDFMHKRNMLHRCVHIFVETPKTGKSPSKFVLQLKKRGTENGGKISSAVSGHVHFNEPYIKAAIRETAEELGIDVAPEDLKEVLKIEASEQTGNEFITLYSCVLDKTDNIDPNPDELDGVLLCPLKDIEEAIKQNPEIFSPVFILLLNMFLELMRS